MLNRIKILLFSLPIVFIAGMGCKKGTFDINNNNPNVPSSVSPDYVLSAALTTSAAIAQGGDADFANLYMGYWAVSGDYIPSSSLLTYNLNTDFYADNWNSTYIALENYKYIANHATSVNYTAIARIMTAYSYERIVDLYNNAPYSSALQGGTNNYPTFDDAKTIYLAQISQLDSAVNEIKSAPSTAATPSSADVMFGGKMSMWVKFANTLKLKMLINLTQTSYGPGLAQTELSGLTASDFLGAGQDAAVNPGYSNSSNSQQSPLWQDIGLNSTGTPYTNNAYYRANSYAVNFYQSTNDPRLTQYYAVSGSGSVKGRAFGSTALEHNSAISGFGPGVLKSASQSAIILPACESFFLQAEAIVRGYLTTAGTAQAAYQNGVTESFRLLGVSDYANAAATYTSQNDPRVNWSVAPDPITLIITQAWAAYNVYDPIEAWNNWRRLGIPANIPVSIYPGTTATHIPYRLQYPTSEYSYNASNVNQEGTVDPLSSKVFFMP